MGGPVDAGLHPSARLAAALRQCGAHGLLALAAAVAEQDVGVGGGELLGADADGQRAVGLDGAAGLGVGGVALRAGSRGLLLAAAAEEAAEEAALLGGGAAAVEPGRSSSKSSS
ncbi:hypothetical protein GCM10020000_31410 [Streptomyces olivoverticillatus]